MKARYGSHPELAKVVIEVFVLHHAPAPSRNPPKHTAGRPGGSRTAIRKASNQVAQSTNVRFPCRGSRRKKLWRTLSPALRPRHHVDHQPVERRMRKRAGGRRGLQLPERLAQVAADVADHLRRLEAPPQRLTIRREVADAS